jgi:hypothetical protein
MATAMERLDEHDTRIRTLETKDAASAVSVKGIERRLDQIESTLTWLVRLIIGAIILAVVGFALNGGMQL